MQDKALGWCAWLLQVSFNSIQSIDIKRLWLLWQTLHNIIIMTLMPRRPALTGPDLMGVQTSTTSTPHVMYTLSGVQMWWLYCCSLALALLEANQEISILLCKFMSLLPRALPYEKTESLVHSIVINVRSTDNKAIDIVDTIEIEIREVGKVACMLSYMLAI